MDGFNFDASSFKLPDMPEIIIPPTPQSYMWADTQYEIIRKHIQEFENSLDNDSEVGLMLTNMGQSVLLYVTEIDYENPVILVFRGFVNGQPATLVQHINQLSFLMTKVPRENPQKPKRKIGFKTGNEDE